MALCRDLEEALEPVPDEIDLEECLESLCEEVSAGGGADCRCAAVAAADLLKRGSSFSA